jgi:hypothetical protein
MQSDRYTSRPITTGGATTPRTNGFVKRFNGTILEEFFRVKLHEWMYTDVNALQDDLDAWLCHYNHERAPSGYRNNGRHPQTSSTSAFFHPRRSFTLKIAPPYVFDVGGESA